MKNWEEKIVDFIDKYNGPDTLSDEDIREFVEEGLQPFVDNHMGLKECALELANINLEIFGPILKNKQMKYSALNKNITAILKLVDEGEYIQ